MSSVDEGGVAVRREADVVAMSEDGEAGDAAAMVMMELVKMKSSRQMTTT
jgi:hypothetical protein